jgi:hypothetical protein
MKGFTCVAWIQGLLQHQALTLIKRLTKIQLITFNKISSR